MEAIRSPGYGSGRNGEAMLNHLDDLLSRLAEVDRRPGEVPGPEEFADKALVKRALDTFGDGGQAGDAQGRCPWRRVVRRCDVSSRLLTPRGFG